MARFYGTINAGRTTATKCGHPATGISATARGWEIGGEVSMRAAGDTDTVHLEVTPGSNGAGNRLHVGTFTRDGRGAYTCTGGALLDLIEAVRWCVEYINENMDDSDTGEGQNALAVVLNANGALAPFVGVTA